MAKNITNEFRKYLANLTATSTICTAFGTTFTSGNNLFVYAEPAIKRNLITIIPLSGTSPTSEGDRHNNDVRIRIKHKRNASAIETAQSVINKLHTNTVVCASCNGKVFARQSSPIVTGFLEGGEYMIAEANFAIKNVKLS
jgi:hypothetical protein